MINDCTKNCIQNCAVKHFRQKAKQFQLRKAPQRQTYSDFFKGFKESEFHVKV